MTQPLPRIETPRFTVRLAEAGEERAVVDYYLRNRNHLEPLEPQRGPHFYDEDAWAARLPVFIDNFRCGYSMNVFLFPRQETRKIVGAIGFSNFVRGAFQACYLGYSLDQAYEGQGCMREALEGAIPYVFNELRLHRIMASYMPRNQRSGGLLRRLGFEVEGYARAYLQINGLWEDHILTSLTNRDLPAS
ncbi:MAG TPA: ribosomal protein S5-alanine N-acetyltransferase [Chthoniobacterales bacterium]